MFTYQPTDPNNPLQDIAYEYHLAGNILAIHDRAPNSGTQSQPGKLDRQFSYDPLNRLLDATGRQCDALPSETPGNPWNDKPCCEDITRTKGYSEKYEYDPVGNITSLIHNSGSTGFTRNFAIAQGSNRLDKMNINGYLYSYAYDDNGNLVKENESRHYEWDHSDRMLVYRYQSDGSEPTSYVCSLYDSQGNRVKKLVRNKGGAVEVTVYIDGVFEHCHRPKQDGTALEEDNTLHIMDDRQRIATMRTGKFSDDNTPAVKYCLGDHLGSSNVVIDDSSSWVNREEFTPYGETSFGSFARKRYRFTGKERDGESGLYYHGARYYAPWLGRWMSCDPKGMVDGVNLYVYAKGNPALYIDSNGTNSNTPEVEQVNSKQLKTFDESKQTSADRNRPNKLEEYARDRFMGLPPKQQKIIDEQKNSTSSYYSPQDQSLDKPDSLLRWLPGFKSGWEFMEALTGHTVSGRSVDRSERLLSAGFNLAMDWGNIQLLAGASRFMGGAFRSLSLKLEASAISGRVTGDLASIESRAFPTFSLPTRAGKGPTYGTIEFPGISGNVLVKSGSQGPSRYMGLDALNIKTVESILAKRGYMPGNIVDVEVHASAQMRLLGVKEATLRINNPKICCRCQSVLENLLQEGQRLKVIDATGKMTTFIGRGKWY